LGFQFILVNIENLVSDIISTRYSKGIEEGGKESIVLRIAMTLCKHPLPSTEACQLVLHVCCLAAFFHFVSCIIIDNDAQISLKFAFQCHLGVHVYVCFGYSITNSFKLHEAFFCALCVYLVIVIITANR
jgi:hypothetical protein